MIQYVPRPLSPQTCVLTRALRHSICSEVEEKLTESCKAEVTRTKLEVRERAIRRNNTLTRAESPVVVTYLRYAL